MIEVKRLSDGDPLTFDVIVRGGNSETRHDVTMTQATYERLTGGKYVPERCVEAAFRLLLDREPKESILGRFELALISRYFPDFEENLPHSLVQSDL